MTVPPETPPWPPDFSIRISPRAKYPRLRVQPGTGLEVVLPRIMQPETATELVERHKEWICKALNRICGSTTNTQAGTLPFRVCFHGDMDERAILCKGENADTANPIRLRSSRDDTPTAIRELQNWTRTHAANILGREIALLAERHSLRYASVKFRRQKSRWGSCSALGAINLNTCLIFLPLDLTRLVIMHELAHTRHMDHGQGFWKTLFAMEPKALQLDKRLRSAWRFVPAWMWR